MHTYKQQQQSGVSVTQYAISFVLLFKSALGHYMILSSALARVGDCTWWWVGVLLLFH